MGGGRVWVLAKCEDSEDKSSQAFNALDVCPNIAATSDRDGSWGPGVGHGG